MCVLYNCVLYRIIKLYFVLRFQKKCYLLDYNVSSDEGEPQKCVMKTAIRNDMRYNIPNTKHSHASASHRGFIQQMPGVARNLHLKTINHICTRAGETGAISVSCPFISLDSVPSGCSKTRREKLSICRILHRRGAVGNTQRIYRCEREKGREKG